ncbi:MAG: hypothetical protein ACE5KK_01910 [Candidatus Brocadiales bacterium]
MSQGSLGKKTLALILFSLLLFTSPDTQAVEELPEDLFKRVCTMCHGWAVENFFMADGTVDGMRPICPPPTGHWLPIILTVATYRVYVDGVEKSFPLIPRRDVTRLAEYLNENYPKEPICATSKG